ncbi:uracil-DNA glycosylase family protein [Panacagrimonas sp.]|uniref:uracil-DNA glycosylase family protein n=1 Tax=Panacagrimonas sp. TaxID=2480088 RepID=UPI003B52988E
MPVHAEDPATPLELLLSEIRACTLCSGHLPLGPRPVLRAAPQARLLIVGQAPGTKVHASGVPWNDASGERLRQWMDVDRDTFYDAARIAIVPMGFCYPGRGKGGDLPPRPECAPQWHLRVRTQMPRIGLTLLIGQYAQAYYLPGPKQALEDTVRDWRRHLANGFFPLPHPSPRNTLWLRRRPWFEAEVLPQLRAVLQSCLSAGVD